MVSRFIVCRTFGHDTLRLLDLKINNLLRNGKKNMILNQLNWLVFYYTCGFFCVCWFYKSWYVCYTSGIIHPESSFTYVVSNKYCMTFLTWTIFQNVYFSYNESQSFCWTETPVLFIKELNSHRSHLQWHKWWPHFKSILDTLIMC